MDARPRRPKGAASWPPSRTPGGAGAPTPSSPSRATPDTPGGTSPAAAGRPPAPRSPLAPDPAGPPPEEVDARALMPGILADPPPRYEPPAPPTPPIRGPPPPPPSPPPPSGPFDPAVAFHLHRFIRFPYFDPSQPLCDCGCGVHREVNDIVAALCDALLTASQWDYARYKRLFDNALAAVDAAGPAVPFIARTGLVAFGRQTGVTHYAWAIVDDRAASETLDVIHQVLAQCGLSPLHTIVSIGAGNGYVEHVFQRQAPLLGLDLQVVAYDAHPGPTSYLPVRPGSPANLLTDFETDGLADCALLLCWPPLGTSLPDGSYNVGADPANPTNTMASDALRNFEARGGRVLIYIGERTVFGCTGDPAFHHTLAEGRWVLVNEDASGRSTIAMDKWCPQPHTIPTGYSSYEHQIGGVSGNDNIWVYFLPPEPAGPAMRLAGPPTA